VLVVAEEALRARANEYRSELVERWPNSRVVFASKAFPCTAIQAVMVQEGLGLDVAGGGEAQRLTTLTLGARGSLGFNTQNMDNYVRSGDYYAIDLAAAFRTPVGVVGPHVITLRQYTDDTGSPLGPNRLSITGAGFFYTVPIRALAGGLNVAYMKTTNSKNSLDGDFVQLRFSKVFF
jgi:hypothetical protein